MMDGEGGYLTDFGISKAVKGAPAHRHRDDHRHAALHGPEQAKGHEVDGRADQYALAIVGHQLLTGKQPFDGPAHSILYKQVFEGTAAHAGRDPARCASATERRVGRALSKEPEKRFPNMEEFASAVGGERRSEHPTVVSLSGPPRSLRVSRSGRSRAARRVHRGDLLRRPFGERSGAFSVSSERPARAALRDSRGTTP